MKTKTTKLLFALASIPMLLSLSACPKKCKHVWGDWEISIPSTCTKDGLKKRICEECNEVETEVIEKKGHIVVHDDYVAPTCTKDGLTEGSHCDRCDEIFVQQVVIPATGHSYDNYDGSCSHEGCTSTSHKGTISPESNISVQKDEDDSTGDIEIDFTNLVVGLRYRIESSDVDFTATKSQSKLVYKDGTVVKTIALTSIAINDGYALDFVAESETAYFSYRHNETESNTLTLKTYSYDAFGNSLLENGIPANKISAEYDVESTISKTGLSVLEVSPKTNRILLTYPTDSKAFNQAYKIYDENGDFFAEGNNGSAVTLDNDAEHPSKFYIHITAYKVDEQSKVKISCEHDPSYDGTCTHCHSVIGHQHTWSSGNSFTLKDTDAYLCISSSLFDSTKQIIKFTYSSDEETISKMKVDIYEPDGGKRVPNNDGLIQFDPTVNIYLHFTFEKESTVTVSFEQSAHFYPNGDGFCSLCGQAAPMFNVSSTEVIDDNVVYNGYLYQGTISKNDTISYFETGMEKPVDVTIASIKYYDPNEGETVSSDSYSATQGNNLVSITVSGLSSGLGKKGGYFFEKDAFKLVTTYSGYFVSSIYKETTVSNETFNVLCRNTNNAYLLGEATLTFDDETVQLEAGEMVKATLELPCPYIPFSSFEFKLMQDNEIVGFFAEEYGTGLSNVAVPREYAGEELIRPEVFYAVDDQTYTTPKCEEMWNSDVYSYAARVENKDSNEYIYEVTDRLFGLTLEQIGSECYIVIQSGSTYSKQKVNIDNAYVQEDKEYIVLDREASFDATNVIMILVEK